MVKQNIIKEGYKDFLNQGFKKISFKKYKEGYLKMDKEIKEYNKKEEKRLNDLSKGLNECLNLLNKKEVKIKE